MSHALVKVTDRAREDTVVRRTCRADADFVAHLIATADNAPQTCARRRAAPAEAVSAYREASRPALRGRMVSRWL